MSYGAYIKKNMRFNDTLFVEDDWTILSNEEFEYLYQHDAIGYWIKHDPCLSEYDKTESGDCFVVATGPSLSCFDFDCLIGKKVITAGRSVVNLPWAQYAILTDNKYFRKRGLLSWVFNNLFAWF